MGEQIVAVFATGVVVLGIVALVYQSRQSGGSTLTGDLFGSKGGPATIAGDLFKQ